MITYLEGKLVEKQPTRIVVDVGGLGYEVLIPLSSYDNLPEKDETCRVLTCHYVREDNESLFGFMTNQERKMFCMLIGISGIGPKLALSALSGLSVRELNAAVIEGDVKRLASISGVGKKTAERIIVELKHKIDTGDALEAAAGGTEPSIQDERIKDAVLALVALGFKQADARKKVTAVLGQSGSNNLSIENVIKNSLRR